MLGRNYSFASLYEAIYRSLFITLAPMFKGPTVWGVRIVVVFVAVLQGKGVNVHYRRSAPCSPVGLVEHFVFLGRHQLIGN